jgi:hypothetical protein
VITLFGIYSKELNVNIKLAHIFFASFVQNCSNLKKMEKQTVVSPDLGILFSTKMKWALKPWKKGMCLKYILLSERSQSEKVSCYMISAIWHFGKDKTIETTKRSGEGEMNRLNTEKF